MREETHERLLIIQVKSFDVGNLCGKCQFKSQDSKWCHLFEQKLNHMWYGSPYLARLKDCKNAFQPPNKLSYSRDEDEE